MKVLVLGGAGGAGRHTARVAASLDGVDQLVIGDVSGTRATELAARLGPRIGAVGVDVRDRAALDEVMAGADVVCNCTGPFFRYGLDVLTASIDNGCHYLDICDDPEPTLQMLELSDRARARDVTAVVGMGFSPGMTNLLAALAAGELSSVHTVYTGWNIDSAVPDSPTSTAAVEHGVAQMTGQVPAVRGGRLVRERPLRRVRVDYPGLGRETVRTFGHPEAVTLAESLRADTSLNVCHAAPGTAASIVAVARLVDLGVLSAAAAGRLVGWMEHRIPHASLHSVLGDGQLPIGYAVADGLRDGRSARVGAALTAVPGLSMGEVTGVPLAVALQLLVAGAITARGVLPPERAIDPRVYFDAVSAHCPDVEPGESILSVTRSWDPDAATVYRDAQRLIRRRATAMVGDLRGVRAGAGG